MTKTDLLNRFAGNGEQRILLARLLDRKEWAESRSVPAHTGFLSPAEQAAAAALLKACGPVRAYFFGGFDGAERQICAFLPDWLEPKDWKAGENCPVCALRAEASGPEALNHRDFLGSLMGLGITREKIGDILLEGNTAVVLTLREQMPILLSQWEKVGRHPVKLTEISLKTLEAKEPQTKLVRDTVASLRLDAVLAAGFSLSRTRAAELITGGQVSVNHLPCDKTDRTVEAGDVFSCRGLGKCVLTRAEGKSRKGRIILELERYL